MPQLNLGQGAFASLANLDSGMNMTDTCHHSSALVATKQTLTRQRHGPIAQRFKRRWRRSVSDIRNQRTTSASNTDQMAEVIGVTASLVALIGLTTTIAQGIYNAHQAVTKVTKDLQGIKNDITIFSGILRDFQSLIPLEEQQTDGQTDVFSFMCWN
jgi:hypothetical protein